MYRRIHMRNRKVNSAPVTFRKVLENKCDPNFYNQFIDFPHSLKQKDKKETFINIR